MVDREHTFIDLFSGCGGLTLGLQQAGWNCLLAVDHWKDAIATHRHNLRDHAAENVDIHDLNERRLSKLLVQRPTWVVGGPPCQGFSTVGKRQRQDPRNELVREFREVVRILQPDGFLIENVFGLKVMHFERPLRALFEGLGYTVTALELRAADYGVPQLRRRIVFVGHRARGRFKAQLNCVHPAAYTTVWDAIGDLPAVGPGETETSYDKEPFTEYQRRLRGSSQSLQGHTVSKHPKSLVKAISFIPDGGNRKSIPPRYQPSSGYHNSYSRLSSTAPAVAVTSNMGKPSGTRCVHPFQHRGLTAREGARLQSFPDTFHFLGGVVSQRLQVANAVPVLLAEALGHALADEARWENSAREPLLAAAG
ncbi:MAG: DNA cytosine methyltransferase [Actinomycetota bacterium]|nr:DNA cytosine methyltransferase [Actinomycetota bacterium]